MIIFSIGVIALVLSGVVFLVSYRMYSYNELVRDGFAFVRVSTMQKSVYYGWVRKNTISAMDQINHEKYQWFIELYSTEKYVIKIESIQEIRLVKSPIEVALHSNKRVLIKGS